jgi:hypothetical protein
MKTKASIFCMIIALAGPALAGPSDAAAFAIRAAKEHAAAAESAPAAVVSHSTNDTVKYVAASNTKGGIALLQSSEPATTNIALFKSKKGANAGASCCAKH